MQTNACLNERDNGLVGTLTREGPIYHQLDGGDGAGGCKFKIIEQLQVLPNSIGLVQSTGTNLIIRQSVPLLDTMTACWLAGKRDLAETFHISPSREITSTCNGTGTGTIETSTLNSLAVL